MELIGNRVTQRSISNTVLLGLNANQDRMAAIQQRLATGKNISKPSDDPTGTISALQMRGDVRRNETWQRNGQDGLTWLGTTDSALTSALEVVRRVRDLTVQAASTGGNDSVSAEALATEIDKLKENLIGIANTKYIDRPVFGGTTAGGLAYDATGNYVGDANANFRTVGSGSPVRVDVTGDEVFGTGVTSIFQVLTDTAATIRTPGSSPTTKIADIDAAMQVMTNQLTDIGARYKRVDQAIGLSQSRVLDLKNNISTIEDVDLAKTITDLSLQNTAYQASLSAAAKVIQPSLLDFIR